MELYFTHYYCVIIVLFGKGLCRSAFSMVSFEKLIFCGSVLSLKQDIKICIIMVCSFVLTLYKNSPSVNNKLFTKVLQYYLCKNMLSEMFWVFQKKKLIYKEMCGTVKIKSFKNVIMRNVGYRRFSNLCKYSMQ